MGLFQNVYDPHSALIYYPLKSNLLFTIVICTCFLMIADNTSKMAKRGIYIVLNLYHCLDTEQPVYVYKGM